MPEQRLAKIVGETIAAKRKQMGFSQEYLAEQVGVSQESLSRMEKGNIAPKFERLRGFALALRCSVADLFRTPDEGADERAATIADMLRALPPEGQEAAMRIMVEMIRMVKAGRK